MFNTPLRGSVELFVDSASLDTIKYWLERGATGVTTNPSIVCKEFPPDLAVTRRTAIWAHLTDMIEVIHPYPLSIQTMSEDVAKIVTQAQYYRSLAEHKDGNNVVVKVPYSSRKGTDLLPVIRQLSELGVPVNATCLITEDQMLSAIMNGARYVSLFVGRVWENGADPIEILRRVRRLIDRKNLSVQIIAGSIRQTDQVSKCWDSGCGAHIVTVPPDILKKWGQNDTTVDTTQEMLANAEKLGLLE